MKKVVLNSALALFVAGAAVLTSCEKEGATPSTITAAENTAAGSATITGKVYMSNDLTGYNFNSGLAFAKNDTLDDANGISFADGEGPNRQSELSPATGFIVKARYNPNELRSESGQPDETPAEVVLIDTVAADGSYSFEIPTGATSDGVAVTLDFDKKMVDVKYPTFAIVKKKDDDQPYFVADSTVNGLTGDKEFILRKGGDVTISEKIIPSQERIGGISVFNGDVEIHDVEYYIESIGQYNNYKTYGINRVIEIANEQIGQ